MPLLRVVQYNPASTRTASRLEDICQEFEKRDIIVLVGTQEKAKTENGIRELHVGPLTGIEAGYMPSPHANKSCGITVLWQKRRYRRARVHLPPRQLWGRGAAVELGQGDGAHAVLGVYFPPRPRTVAGLAKYRRTVTALAKWVAWRLRRQR